MLVGVQQYVSCTFAYEVHKPYGLFSVAELVLAFGAAEQYLGMAA